MSDRLSHSADLIHWLDEQIGDLSFAGDNRAKVSAACIDLARWHHRAVVSLVIHGMHAAAAALLRVLVEAYIKGVWLHRCSTETEFKEFTEDRLRVSFDCMIRDIERLPDFNCGVLSLMKKTNWKAFNSYTHTGYFAVDRHLNGQTVGPNVSDDQICEILGFADSVALMAALEFAYLVNDEALLKALYGKAAEISGGVSPA